MSLERKHDDLIKPPFNPEELLSDFYGRLYLRDKHDSPEQSRISLIRRIRGMIIANEVLPKRVLNIGSGPQALEKQMLTQGRETPELMRTVQFTSIDLAQIVQTRLLGLKINNLRHIQGNAVALPFKDKSFGLVVSNHAIDFCPQEDAFREAHRVLSDEGSGIFYLHHPSMLRNPHSNKDIRVFWEYLKDNAILFSNSKDIEKFLRAMGFFCTEISLKSDNVDTWWEVVVKKEKTHE
jgi:ubiquinone/menaquinone biosynthesis C-methylase UbiE